MTVSRIEKQIDDCVHTFCDMLAQKFDSFEEEEKLFQLWRECSKVRRQKQRKRSAYQNFYKSTYKQLKMHSPKMSFGEMATHISQMWKALSQNEKNMYASVS
jgi:Mg2+ and Co2+ transporter CorA